MCISRVAEHTSAFPALWTYMSDALAWYIVQTTYNVFFFFFVNFFFFFEFFKNFFVFFFCIFFFFCIINI